MRTWMLPFVLALLPGCTEFLAGPPIEMTGQECPDAARLDQGIHAFAPRGREDSPLAGWCVEWWNQDGGEHAFVKLGENYETWIPVATSGNYSLELARPIGGDYWCSTGAEAHDVQWKQGLLIVQMKLGGRGCI